MRREDSQKLKLHKKQLLYSIDTLFRKTSKPKRYHERLHRFGRSEQRLRSSRWLRVRGGRAGSWHQRTGECDVLCRLLLLSSGYYWCGYAGERWEVRYRHGGSGRYVFRVDRCQACL